MASCGCGCGGEILWKPHHSYLGAPKFIHGHNRRGTESKRSPEVCKQIGERSRLRWAAMTPEQYAAYCAKLSNAHQKRWDETSPERRKERGKASQEAISPAGRARIAAAQTKRWAEPAAHADFAQKISKNWRDKPEDEKAAKRSNLRKGVRQAWREGKLEYTGTKTWFHTCPSGRIIRVQSSWEAEVASFLDTHDVQFERGGRYDLGPCGWSPDFLVQGSFLLEVKGHPLAKKQFDDKQYPAIVGSNVLPFPAAILDFKLSSRGDITTVEALIGALKWVYVPEGLAFAPEQLYAPLVSCF